MNKFRMTQLTCLHSQANCARSIMKARFQCGHPKVHEGHKTPLDVPCLPKLCRLYKMGPKGQQFLTEEEQKGL